MRISELVQKGNQQNSNNGRIFSVASREPVGIVAPRSGRVANKRRRQKCRSTSNKADRQALAVIQRKDMPGDAGVVTGQKAGANDHQVGRKQTAQMPTDDGDNRTFWNLLVLLWPYDLPAPATWPVR